MTCGGLPKRNIAASISCTEVSYIIPTSVMCGGILFSLWNSIIMGSPYTLPSTSLRVSLTAGLNLSTYPDVRIRFFFCAIRVISSHSLEEKDRGFSTNTLMLCSITFLATIACVFVGVHTRQPSSRSFSSISSIAEYACAPCLLATSLALAKSRSHIAARQSSSLNTLAWFLPHPPTPITAILVLGLLVSTIQGSTTPCTLWLLQTPSWHTSRGCSLSMDLPFRFQQGDHLYWSPGLFLLQ